MQQHPVISEWGNDPEFIALPDEVKQQVIVNYFDGNLVDEEFYRLSTEQQQQVRTSFVQAHSTKPRALSSESLFIAEYNQNNPESQISEIGETSYADYPRALAIGLDSFGQTLGRAAQWAGADETGKAIEDHYKEREEENRSALSPAFQYEQQKTFLSDKEGEFFGEGVTSVPKIVGTIIESAPSMAVGMGAGTIATRLLMKAGMSAGLAGILGSGFGEGGIAAVESAKDFEDIILNAPAESLLESDEFESIYNSLPSSLSVKERFNTARRQLAADTAQWGALKVGGVTALTGAPSGWGMGKVIGGETGKTLLGTVTKQGALEAVQEAPQSAYEVYAANEVVKENVDPSRDLMKGTGEAAVAGAITGGVMGVGFGGGAHNIGKPERTAKESSAIANDKPTDLLNEEQEQEERPIQETRPTPEPAVQPDATPKSAISPEITLNAKGNPFPFKGAEIAARNKSEQTGKEHIPVEISEGKWGIQEAPVAPLVEEEPVLPAEEIGEGVEEPVLLAEEAPEETEPSVVPETELILDADPFETLMDGEQAETPLAAAAHEAATSPVNNLPEPTQAQKEAGNYKKGHARVLGMDIAIENPAGSERSGVDGSGKDWSVQMQHHYGYIKGTEGKDKDHLDLFIKDGIEADQLESKPVYVVDQINEDGSFDEHKIMAGFENEQEARAGYLSNYEEGWTGLGAITEMSPEKFKEWIKKGKTKRAVRYKKPSIDSAAAKIDTERAGMETPVFSMKRNPGPVSKSSYKHKLPVESDVRKALNDLQKNMAGRSVRFPRQENHEGSEVSGRRRADLSGISLYVVNKADRTSQAAKKIAQSFGKELHFVASDSQALPFDGVYSSGKYVFINADSAVSTKFVLGHEMLHALRRDAPEIYSTVKKTFDGLADEARLSDFVSAVKAERDKAFQAAGESADYHEETVADISGDLFMEPEFWKELSGREPNAFHKFALNAIDQLNQILSKLNIRRGAQSTVKDVRRMRDAIATAMREYREQAEPSADSGVRLSLSKGTVSKSSTVGEVKAAISKLETTAVNSGRTEVVQSIKDLPQHIQDEFNATGGGTLEAAYSGGTSYFVADSIPSNKRAVQLWMHEQGIHKGLLSFYSDKDRKELLNRVHLSAAKTPMYKAIVDLYGLDISKAQDREIAAEEYLAHIGEKVSSGEVLSGQEKTIWQRVVEMFRRWLNQLGFSKDATLTYEEIEQTVADVISWTVHGPAGQHDFTASQAVAYSKGGEEQLDKKRNPAQLQGSSASRGRDQSRLQLSGEIHSRSSKRKIIIDKDTVKPPRTKEVRLSRGDTTTPAGITKAELKSNDVLSSAVGKIGAEKTSPLGKLKEAKDEFIASFKQGIFDRFDSLKKLDEKAGITDAEESAYIAARMTTTLSSNLTAIMEYGAPIWNEGAMDVDPDSKGLLQIMEPVVDELDRFMFWMVGHRAAKLMKEGKENLFTKEEIKQLKALNKGREAKYLKVRKEYINFKGRVLDFAEEAGIIDPEGRKTWDHDEYIPFFRIKEEQVVTKPAAGGKGIASRRSGIKELKGGKSNLGDPFENIVINFSHLIDVSLKNKATDLAVTNMVKAGEAVKADPRHKPEYVQPSQAATALRKIFGDTDAVWPVGKNQREQILTIFHSVKPTGNDIIHVLRNGKAEYYHVNDRLLLEALTGIREEKLGGVAMEGARWFKRVLTSSITASPEFMLRNLIRDAVQTSIIHHKSGFHPFKSAKGIMKAARKDEDYVAMMAAGASFSGGYSLGHDPSAAKRMAKKYSKAGIKSESVLDTPKKLAGFISKSWEKWENAGSILENSTRVQIYAGGKERGLSHLEAAFEAKDIMDFSMRGSWKTMRFLCETVPFFGARVQGLHKLGRSYAENPKAFAAKAAMLATASAALYLCNAGNPDYDDLEDWEKDTYFHFFTPEGHFRLPKPFEVGFLFGTLPERITEQFVTDAGVGDFADRMKWNLTQTFAVGLPQIVAPLYEQGANRNTFTDRPIVPMRLQKLAPGEQSDVYTSETMTQIGRATNLSPKRMEHLVRGYFGTVGSYVLTMSDYLVNRLSDMPDAPEMRLEDMPLIKVLYRGDKPRRTRYESELYDLMREADELHSTVKAVYQSGRTTEAQEILSEDGNRKLLKYRKIVFNQLRRRLSDMSKEARVIHASRKLTPKQKRDKLDTLQESRNKLVKKIMKKVSEQIKAE